MQIDRDKYYCIEGSQLARLEAIAKRLYSENRLTGDEMRDMAQIIYEGVIPSVEEMD